MPIWRRGEPLHVRLAREGGLAPEASEPPPHDTTPRWGEVAIHGVPRAREWDATEIVEAPDLEGGEARFVALPDGSLLVEEGGDPAPLAEALEAKLSPPYRAEAVRRDERWWVAAARRIQVVELHEAPEGDELELTLSEGSRRLLVDGAPIFGSVAELERLGAERGESYVVRARRLDGTLWEYAVMPL